ncbi:6010_t:CDS:1, partial [Ambispora gerdemannii]
PLKSCLKKPSSFLKLRPERGSQTPRSSLFKSTKSNHYNPYARPATQPARHIINKDRDPRLRKKAEQEQDQLKRQQELAEQILVERKVSYACFELPNLLLKNPKDLIWLEQHEEFLQNLLGVLRSMNWVFYQVRVEWAMKRVREQREYVEAENRLFAALQSF